MLRKRTRGDEEVHQSTDEELSDTEREETDGQLSLFVQVNNCEFERTQPTSDINLDPTVSTCCDSLHEGQFQSAECVCKECQNYLCHACIIHHHKTHSYINMHDPAHMEAEADHLAKSAGKVSFAIEEHSTARGVIRGRNCAMKKKMKKVCEEVESTAYAWIQNIREQKKKIIHELQIIEQNEQESDDFQLSVIESQISHLEASLKLTNELSTGRRTSQVLLKQHQTIKSNDDLLATKVETNPRPIPSFQFLPNRSLLQTFTTDKWGIGGLWDCVVEGHGLKRATVDLTSTFTINTVVVCSTSRQKLYNPAFTVGVKIPSDYEDVPPNIHDNGEGSYIVQFTPAHPGNHKISVIVDDHEIQNVSNTLIVNRWVVKAEGLRKGKVGLKSQLSLALHDRVDEKVYDPIINLNVRISSPEGTVTPRIHDNKDGTYTVSFFPLQPGEHKVFVSLKYNNPSDYGQDEQVRILQHDIPGSPFTVTVQPRVFRHVLTFGKKGTENGEFDCPWGVAVNKKDEIIVAERDNHRVQIFSCKGEHLRTIGRKGTGKGEFDSPLGVVSDKDNNIIVLDTCNGRLQKFSDTGKFLRSFISKGKYNEHLSYPRGLSLDSDSNVIVTDHGSKRVQIFNDEGKRLQSFDCGDGACHCVYHGDRYYVSAGHPEYCIKVFDKGGNFKYKYGSRGSSPGQFDCPTGLAVDKAACLVVCDCDNDRVQVLKMNGTLVRSFGVRGEGPGQFKGPYSVAVMGDGKFVVCDKGNNRIHIFE